MGNELRKVQLTLEELKLALSHKLVATNRTLLTRAILSNQDDRVAHITKCTAGRVFADLTRKLYHSPALCGSAANSEWMERSLPRGTEVDMRRRRRRG
jgi:hypothetical protein